MPLACVVALWSWSARGLGEAPSQRTFASEVARLSEPGGEFDTDNLVSNERSYLEVVPSLRQAGVTGGAYLGVGPDQSFSYIAQIRPSIAFIVDVRRDNLLLHLLFKALFALARNRAEYLSLLTGRSPPGRIDTWREAPLQRIVAYIDEAARLPQAAAEPLENRLDLAIRGFGVALSREDFDTIHRFHETFGLAGLSLRFQSRGRPPRDYYPTYRELLLDPDGHGRQWNFLAFEDDFQFVRSLETRDRLIPIVGNLGGPHAIAAIGVAMKERGERLSAFYVSNVEDYLFRDGAFGRFVDNLQRLPRDDRSRIIRSIFDGHGGSRSAVQSVNELLAGWSAGKYRSYWELVRPH